jgi:hypothetical protein
MAIVPDVVGFQKGSATLRLNNAGFYKIEFNAVRNGSKIANHGSVQTQRPEAGEEYDVNEPVTINVYEVPSQQVVKRVSVPLEKLPFMTTDGKYYLRYRVVSESGVSTSEWSPVSVLSASKLEDIIRIAQGSELIVPISITSDGSSMFINWEIPEALKNTTFDAYIAWSEDDEDWTDWQFVTTTTANNFSAKIPDEYKTTNVLEPKYFKTYIQIPTKIKMISEYARLVESLAISTRPAVIDGGTVA